jgi:hypothetical protein
VNDDNPRLPAHDPRIFAARKRLHEFLHFGCNFDAAEIAGADDEGEEAPPFGRILFELGHLQHAENVVSRPEAIPVGLFKACSAIPA